MFRFGQIRVRRRPSLTPMIDVVFLLLVFFMLTAQFGRDTAVPLLAAGGSDRYDGPPRLVEVTPIGVSLNGFATPQDDLIDQLIDLTQTPEDLIVLRPDAETTLQRLIDIADLLTQAGFTQLAVVE
ncbi:biopolymer transporter ExbD [Yoonia sp. GPGPB17]|uniref:ExbD/TolR family protein n=1 Tax=Yoonia sp. GPGPB17 TaxID=3026147 RepID=UPI0030C41071